MGYYYIRLSGNASNLYKIILPWVKYRYKHLPMGIANSPDIFQHEINDLFHGSGFIRACIYDLLVLTKVDCTYHVQNLELTLNKMNENDLNVILKSHSSDKPKWNI